MELEPKEKAKELIEYYAETIEPIQYGVILERDWKTAKKCALITVDEMLSFMVESEFENEWWVNYFQEVKKEILNYGK